jgi:DNA-binding CsgD family transcriptional regulator
VAGIIGRAFQNVPNEAASDEIMRDLAELMGENRAIGFTLDPFSLRIEVEAVAGFDRHLANRFMNTYAAVDPWLRELIIRNGVSDVVVVDGLPVEAAKSGNPDGHAFSHDLTTYGISGCAGAVVRVEEGTLGCFCIYSSDPDGFSPAKLDLLRLTVRQLSASATRSADRRQQHVERLLLISTLDLCQIPLCVIDGGSFMIRSNAAAQKMLRKGDVLKMEAGRLTAADVPDASRLAAQIAWVTSNASDDLTGIWQATKADGGRLWAIISPLRLGALNEAGPGHALVRVIDPGLKEEEAFIRGLLRDIFGLTEAEDRVARLIESGLSVAAIADFADLSVATIRSHLSHVLKKTRCASQIELVRVLTRLSLFSASRRI